MIGIDLNFKVNMTLFNDKNITDPKEQLSIKEGIGNMADEVSLTLREAFARHQLDAIGVELNSIDYIEPEDIDIDIAVIEV